MREGVRDVMEITQGECMKRGREGKELSLQDERDLQTVKIRKTGVNRWIITNF